MSNLNENQKVTVTCEVCSRSFEADADATTVFCVHCGARQTVTPAESSKLQAQNGERAHEQMLWRNRLIKTTNPDKRLELIESAAHILEPAVQSVYRNLWHVRFKPSKVKELRWADSWLGFLQLLLTLTRDNRLRRVQKKTSRELQSFFNQKALHPVLNGSALPGGSELRTQWPDPVHILYEELTSVVYLYTDLCLQDKQYGSVLFGFGRKKDTQIEAMIAAELKQIQVAAIALQDPPLPGSALLTRAMEDGYRMRLDPVFAIR